MGVKTMGDRFNHLSLHIMLYLAMVCGFLLFGTIRIQAQAECTIEFNGGIEEIPVEYYYIYKSFPQEYDEGDTLKITDDGKEYNLTYFLNDFYDKDWKDLTECGFGIVPQWEEDYDFYDADQNIGGKYIYRYYLYRVNEKGEPLDAEGNVAQKAEDVDFCAISKPIALISTADHIETTIDGILYLVYNGSDYAEVIMKTETLKGEVVLPKYVTIEGKAYPLRILTSMNTCPDMTKVTIPDTVDTIGAYTFAGNGLKEITIPDSVQEIGSYAFGFNYSQNDETGEVTFTKVPGFVVYGTYGSEAYEYAYNHGLKFVDKKRNAAAVKVKITAKSLKKKKVKLTWKKTIGVSGFEVYKATKKNGKYKKAATIKKASAKSWTKKYAKTKKGKKLYFKVRPYTMVDGSKIYGKWSNIVAAKIRK